MADQSKLRKRLEVLLKKPENQSCADCGKRGPRWASANLGTFFCIECSGIHRNLGVHISFVRSVNLDTWTLKQVEFMEEWGNARANAYYEAKLPRDYPKPRENDPVRVVEKFIREKYEQKRFIADSVPPPVSAQEPEPVKEVRRSTPVVQTPRQVPVTNPAPAPVPVVKPKEEPNLLDFFDSPAPAPAPSAPAASIQADPFQQGGFAAPQPNNFFGTSQPQSDPFLGGASTSTPSNPTPQSAPPPQQQFQDPFFASAPQNQFPQTPQAPPKATADAILSLYATGPAHQGGMPQNSHAQGISMMMPPPGPHMGMGMPRGMPPPMGFGGPQPYGGNMGGMFPPQPHFPGMMGGGMPQQHYQQQQYPPNGMPGHAYPQLNAGYGMPQQNGMYPSQQRGW